MVRRELIEDKHDSSAAGSHMLVWVALAAIALVAGVLGYGVFADDLYRDNSGWGDFVGGLLNPILTCATFIAVLGTIGLQRKELSLTRDEMTRSADALEAQQSALKFQNFETTFFEMLKLHNEIVNSIDLFNSENKMTKSGRDCFDVFVNRLRGRYTKSNGSIRAAYAAFWRDTHAELGHYFRFLYNFIRMVATSDERQPYHVKLIRSQLSDNELVILFYNCLSPQGSKFRQMAADHALFDNLSVTRLFDRSHILCLEREAYGDNQEALGLYDELKAEKDKNTKDG